VGSPLVPLRAAVAAAFPDVLEGRVPVGRSLGLLALLSAALPEGVVSLFMMREPVVLLLLHLKPAVCSTHVLVVLGEIFEVDRLVVFGFLPI
jgi:hypothetical protein